jgi:hypothetical protein
VVCFATIVGLAYHVPFLEPGPLIVRANTHNNTQWQIVLAHRTTNVPSSQALAFAKVFGQDAVGEPHQR